jgi:hypothetical protein
MIAITKFTCVIFGVILYGVILYMGVPCASAAHPSAETHPSDDRGSQGNQDLIKGNSTPVKGDHDGGKVDATKLKADTKKAREEFDKRNAKRQDDVGDKRKDTH